MAIIWDTYNLNNIRDARRICHEMQRRWIDAETMSDVFRYKLVIRKNRIIEGEYGFIVQLNVDRASKRRPPYIMESMKPRVDEDEFNFTKIKPAEKLFEIRFKDHIVSMVVNQSPVTKYHCLLIPKLEEKLPQVLNYEGVQFAIRLLRVFNSSDFKIGFNSPGAGASVNHLHLHLIYSHQEFFSQKAELKKLRSGIYSLSPKYDIQAICFLIYWISFDEYELESAERVYKLVKYLIDSSIPHNVFFALAKHKKKEKVMRILIFPRKQMHIIKSTNDLNIGYCEFGGFFPISDSSIKSEHENNNIILHNETVSESLMEKFNNISGNNTVTDRIIIKVTVVKERLNKNPYRIEQINVQYLSNSRSSSSSNCSPPNQKNDLIFNANTSKKLAKNNHMSQCESIKYATFNQKRAKEYSTTTAMMSNCVNNRNIDTRNIKENTEYMNKALWHLSRSQESIFINNKFPVRNECMAVNQSNTNGTNSNGNINSNGSGGSHSSNSRGNNYITKEIPSSSSSSSSSASTGTMCGNERELSEYTLGISIVQGSDNNVYVKDLVKNGPAEKSGIRIGDQIIAVNGISLLNLSYIESLRLLQNTGLIVELQVSQIFNKNKNSSRPSSLAPARKSQKDNENLVVSRRVASSISKLNYAGNERRNLNSIVTNHCDEYLKRLRRERQETLDRNKQEVDVPLFRDGTTNKMKANCRTAEKDVDKIGGEETVKRIGSFELASDNIRATRDKFKSLRNVNGNLCSLSPAKSMPDLPKVVAIIPKPDQNFDDENNYEKRQVTRTASQSRKYLGPVRYPVTPIKTVLSPVRHQLSLLADSDDEQVFI